VKIEDAYFIYNSLLRILFPKIDFSVRKEIYSKYGMSNEQHIKPFRIIQQMTDFRIFINSHLEEGPHDGCESAELVICYSETSANNV